jgi:hypothetical protein
MRRLVFWEMHGYFKSAAPTADLLHKCLAKSEKRVFSAKRISYAHK